MIKAVFISKGGRREMLDFTNMDEYLAEAQKRHEELVFTSADTLHGTEAREDGKMIDDQREAAKWDE